MADALVFSVLGLLTTAIIDKGKDKAKLLVGVEKEVEKLRRNLLLIRNVIADAEEKKTSNSLVKEWLDRLKEAAYDMEDALDEWRTVVELEPYGPQSTARLQKVGKRHEIALNIREINQALDEIVKDIARYRLVSKAFEPSKGLQRKTERLKQRESSSFVDVSKLCGRDGVKEKILGYLWGGNSEMETNGLIQTISIVGMGGLGKTALAQLVYNDHDVKEHFGSNVIWVCVSDIFDEKAVAKAIIQGLEGLGPTEALGLELNPLEFLLGSISKSIKGKKFLLVLDDVWAKNGERWESLKVTFRKGAPGSRILVTTRDVNVAKMMGSSSSQMIHLEKLGDEDCWKILSYIALTGRDKKTCENLEEIGRKIANRCKGLPLAAKTLGSLLKSKETKQEWQRVLKSDIWKLDLAQKDIFAPLLLSYYDLPPPVRQCFLYCVFFPKDFLYRVHTMIGQWMVQGYLGFNGDADLESIGLEYFHILASRSFFQDFGTNGGTVNSFKMHDMVHDFAQYLAENEFVKKDVKSDHLTIDSAKHRHLMLMGDNQMPFPTSISGAEKLRTLIVFTGDGALSYEAMCSLFNRCRRLRLLDFGWCKGTIKEIPEEIGKLMHLRYLSFSWHPFKSLPEALSNLSNLESLCLMGCLNIEQLPNWMAKLVKLRRLDTRGCLALTHYPKEIQKLTSLRFLQGAIVRADRSDAEEFSLADIGNLKHLSVAWLKVAGNSIDKGEARKVELQNIQELRIHLAGAIEEGDIIEVLDPPSDIVLLKFCENYWFA